MEKAVLFINWSDEDFTYSWDSVEYKFKKSSQTYLPDWQAQHFAKHLVDRELNKKELRTNHQSRKSLESKCFGTEEVEAEDSQKLEMETENLNASNKVVSETEKVFCENCDSKGVRHKKECTRDNKGKSEEDLFEGK